MDFIALYILICILVVIIWVLLGQSGLFSWVGAIYKDIIEDLKRTFNK